MEKPLVSIIAPAYNAEKYLAEAFESVLRQTYSHWELIVVDDGSTDRTAEIAKRYAAKDPRIRYFYQTNQRMASARNAGIKQARGKYVAFLDADNIFSQLKLEKQVAYLEAHPECGVCYGKILGYYDCNPDILYENPQPTYSGNIFRHVLQRNFINVLTTVVRKEALDRFGAFRQGWWGCDEHYVWINLSYHGVQFCHLDEVVGLERLHRDSDSRQKIFLRETAKCFLMMLGIVESWFGPEDEKKYRSDIEHLRVRWKKILFIGKLLAHPILSPILMPFYLARRDKKYRLVESRRSYR